MHLLLLLLLFFFFFLRQRSKRRYPSSTSSCTSPAATNRANLDSSPATSPFTSSLTTQRREMRGSASRGCKSLAKSGKETHRPRNSSVCPLDPDPNPNPTTCPPSSTATPPSTLSLPDSDSDCERTSEKPSFKSWFLEVKTDQGFVQRESSDLRIRERF